ncbi:dGTP triphosphohydrolase [Psychromonas hadalis]|uniref:dGTP triphosphohydrolase n=1 Tax=Psychromonas hadalis TaxID=211669 RepID=UPI0003B6198F|nr:dNTP triphosphohydrolase [Psychromonas hadalis]
MKEQWDTRLLRRVGSLYSQGYRTLDKILPQCDGAQPKDISYILEKVKQEGVEFKTVSLDYKNKFYFNLPAANPLFYQWWYTLDSQEKLSRKVLDETDSAEILCIGTPTIAATLKSYGASVSLLDIDPDLISLFNNTFPENSSGLQHDIFNELDAKYVNSFDSVVIDPPWYEEYFNVFLSRAINATKINGKIYCSIPQVLTREGIEEERRKLTQELHRLGHEVLYVEKSVVQYIIPEFESAAFKQGNIPLSNQPWRYSDLLVIRVGSNRVMDVAPKNIPDIHCYSRGNMASMFRVFLSETNITTGVGLIHIPEFTESISRRDKVPEVNLWTSSKRGYQAEDFNVVKNILKCWSEGKSKAEAIESLRSNGNSAVISTNLIDQFDERLGLWSKYSDGSARRTGEEIKEKNSSTNSRWAQEASKREFGNSSDGFRIEFQRDRDRIIWSSGFRKLADKTQLFPLGEDENLRQRLAHSIEVMQLATTISSSFGLDKDLVEAGALAHDIGHTPFGHAGENAIDRLFTNLGFKCGFNHYEHGVDVVRYLEGSYQHNVFESHPGLNLTPDVCDCILKHTYCHSGETGSHKSVWKNSKHQEYIGCGGFSHLEGQAVRAADKISYLLSDIEDGIRLGIVSYQDLMNCRLFHRPPVDFRMSPSESLYVKFIEQRGSIIKLLMEDVILESSKRISKLSSRNEVRTAQHYCIFHGPEIEADMGEIWDKIQAGKLHRDPRVLSANMRASKIVSELLILYVLYPEHIDERFRVEHERLRNTNYIKFYEKAKLYFSLPEAYTSFLPLNVMIGFNPSVLNNIDTYNLVIAKDYIASLSDKRITSIYHELLSD